MPLVLVCQYLVNQLAIFIASIRKGKQIVLAQASILIKHFLTNRLAIDIANIRNGNQTVLALTLNADKTLSG